MASFHAFKTKNGTTFVNVEHISAIDMDSDGTLSIQLTNNHQVNIDAEQGKEFLTKRRMTSKPDKEPAPAQE